MSLSNRLNQVVVMSGLSARAFASRAGIPPRTMYDYLSGGRKPGADHLAKMYKVGVNVEWLLTGEARPQISFDFAKVASLRPVSGVALADPQLNTLLIGLAVERVDEYLKDHPEIMAKLGVSGIMASVWSIYSTFADAAEAFADQFEQARRAGFEVDRLAAMVATAPKGAELVLHNP
jgi:transcriptional regulator with XRE-family HTH domain